MDGVRLKVIVIPVEGMTLFELHVVDVGVTQARRPSEVLHDVLDYAMEVGVGDVADVEVDWTAVRERLCCSQMANQICRICQDHWDLSKCPDQLIIYSGEGDYGLAIHDGGSSFLVIDYCPWCGQRLRMPRVAT